MKISAFMSCVRNAAVPADEVGVFWMGQAGFYLKTASGLRIAIDPYLSDLCERLVGFKRITPAVCTMEDFDADVLLLSHEHPDHCDTDLLEVLSRRERAPWLVAPVTCRQSILASGICEERVTYVAPGDSLELEGMKLTALTADHGPECSGALGFLLDFGCTSVYFAGDTTLSPALLRPALEAKPEIALLPINGEYGNLSAAQAAQLADLLDCKVLIPCHFWTFVEHGSAPKELLDIAQAGTSWRLDILAQGEGRIYGNAEQL